MIGRTLGRYRVLEKIGRGGMGEVFLAEDASLRRRVALKFLPPEMQRDAEALKRFLREARSAAALDHPYICHINEVAEAEGREFIVMEYVDGEALRARIGQGPLTLEETLRIGIEVAEALEAAHGKAIVHRDIKPENIMLTRTGHAKVMDFGLAKQVGAPAGEAEIGGPTMTLVTSEGTTAGTLAYMPPEQLRGQDADARSDIWSLGVTLYEMASGARPFQGQSGFELSSTILNNPPLPLPANVPAELGAVISRCLEKEPDKRYRTATDLRAALEEVRAGTASVWAAWRYRLARRRWLAPVAGAVLLAAIVFGLNVGGLRALLTGATGRPIKLAVLPFENLTGDPEQEILGDGLTQDMISELGRLQPARMSVIGKVSVMRYKKSGAPLEQIGRELGVGYVLSGSWRKEGARVRITAELIQVRDQTQLWNDVYEREMSGMLALQREVARKVAGALALRLLPGDEARLARVRTVDPEAYEAYLRSVHYRETLSKEGYDAAERYLKLALERDANYAAAWAGLSRVWGGRQQMGWAPFNEASRKTKEAAARALELDSTEVEAHRALAGLLTWLEWDWSAAGREWERVLELDPGYADSMASYSHYLMHMGRKDEAMAMIEKALESDPFNVKIQCFYAMDLNFAGRYNEAIAAARKALGMQRNSQLAATALMTAYFAKSMYAEALALEKERCSGDADLLEALEKGYAEGGYPGAWKRLADTQAARFGEPGALQTYHLANLYLYAGERERVFEWLEKAYEERNRNMPYLTLHFASLNSDPRFQDIVRRVGLPR